MKRLLDSSVRCQEIRFWYNIVVYYTETRMCLSSAQGNTLRDRYNGLM